MVRCAATSKVAAPPQVSVPSTEVAVRVIEKPTPTGSGLIKADSVVLLPTSMVPAFEKAPGPEML